MASLTLPDGSVLNGTPAELAAVIASKPASYNPAEYYLSKSANGFMKIAEMNSPHLQRAINKRYALWVATLGSKSIPDFIEALKSGPQDVTTLAMIAELIKRGK